MTESSAERGVFANEQMGRILDQTELSTINLSLSAETWRLVEETAEAMEKSFREVLGLALAYGIGILSEQHRLDGLSAGEEANVKGMVRESQEIGSLHAGMYFQMYKLGKGVIVEDARLAGTAGQNETFRNLIAELRRRLHEP